MLKFGLSMKWAFVAVTMTFALAEVHGLASPASTSPQSTASKKRPAKNSSKRHRAAAYQVHPDPERYQEIQKTLSDKGYFKGEVNGHWAGDSVDALKRFQADQKLEPDGKINALTLSALGLGPKHDGSAPAPPASVPNPSAGSSTAPTPRPPQ
jgi:hypothetical protein